MIETFTAVVIACFASGDCFEFEDTLTPHTTIEQCADRLNQMIPALAVLVPTFGPVVKGRGLCRPDNGEGTES